MNEAKAPDSDTDWQNIDIFLFSNGQKQTPPRKYHLGAEDLTRWSSTLMTLANAQYGSIFSSIDLYTVEGHKVDTPMQIINGAAYVAVPPQDTFIPSGYNDYLLKASRSRDKRQGKYMNNAQVELRQDEFDTKIQAAEIEEAKEEVEKVETLNEETNNDAATSTVGDQVNMVPKIQPHYPARINSALKQSERMTSNINNSTILRKQNSLISPPMVRKTSMKLKENPLRKNLKVNTTKGPNSGSTIFTNSNNQLRTNTKTLTKTGKNAERQSTLRNLNDRPKIEKKIELPFSVIDKDMYSTEKTVTTDNTALENVIDDNELIVVKKQDSENRSIMYSEVDKSGTLNASRQTRLSSIVPILMPIEESGISKDEPPVTVINNLIENVYKPDADIINRISSKIKSKVEIDDSIPATDIINRFSSKTKNKMEIDDNIPARDIINRITSMTKNKLDIGDNIPATDIINRITSKTKNKVEIDDNIQKLQEDKIKLINKPPVNSFIAVIDEGDVVNLNLKIQVKKGDGVINAQDSKTINSIKQKASQASFTPQVNIDQEMVETITKPPNHTSNFTVDEDNLKVVVIQCSCCENHNISEVLEKINTGTVRLDDKKYVILLPEPPCHKNVERNQSTREEIPGKEKSLSVSKSSVVNPVKKVFATTSIQGLTVSKTTEDIGITVSNLDSRDANAQNKPEVVENVEINRNLSSIRKIYQTDSSTLTKNKPGVQTTLVDNSTQTEWCTMLVEARRHEDGRYSFFLPTLDVLKHYGL